MGGFVVGDPVQARQTGSAKIDSGDRGSQVACQDRIQKGLLDAIGLRGHRVQHHTVDDLVGAVGGLAGLDCVLGLGVALWAVCRREHLRSSPTERFKFSVGTDADGTSVNGGTEIFIRQGHWGSKGLNRWHDRVVARSPQPCGSIPRDPRHPAVAGTRRASGRRSPWATRSSKLPGVLCAMWRGP